MTEENLCSGCEHKCVCSVPAIGAPWNLRVSGCNHYKVSFSSEKLREAEEQARRIEAAQREC